MTDPDGIRPAGLADAPQIAALFRLTYESSSHPCNNDDFVSATLQQSAANLWLVSEHGGRISGCMGVLWHRWNRSCGMTCNLHFSGIFGGITYAPASDSVRAGRRSTVTIVGNADIVNGTGTITGNCGSLPAGVTATFHMLAIQVATLHQ